MIDTTALNTYREAYVAHRSSLWSVTDFLETFPHNQIASDVRNTILTKMSVTKAELQREIKLVQAQLQRK
jgi:hypothetical protein